MYFGRNAHRVRSRIILILFLSSILINCKKSPDIAVQRQTALLLRVSEGPAPYYIDSFAYDGEGRLISRSWVTSNSAVIKIFDVAYNGTHATVQAPPYIGPNIYANGSKDYDFGERGHPLKQIHFGRTRTITLDWTSDETLHDTTIFVYQNGYLLETLYSALDSIWTDYGTWVKKYISQETHITEYNTINGNLQSSLSRSSFNQFTDTGAGFNRVKERMETLFTYSYNKNYPNTIGEKNIALFIGAGVYSFINFIPFEDYTMIPDYQETRISRMDSTGKVISSESSNQNLNLEYKNGLLFRYYRDLTMPESFFEFSYLK